MWNNCGDQLPIGASCPLEVQAAGCNGGWPGRCDEDCQLQKLYDYLRMQPWDFNRGNADVAGVTSNCNCCNWNCCNWNSWCGCGWPSWCCR